MTKQCVRCYRVLPLESFTIDKRAKSGRRSHCKQCAAVARRAYRSKHLERITAYHRQYRQKNRERILHYAQKNRGRFRVRQGGYRHKHHLRKFGITSEEYGAMLASQGGMCAICGREPNGRRLAVEHDHKTGKIRGLVCVWCNSTVAWVEHNPQALGALERYLEKAGAMK